MKTIAVAAGRDGWFTTAMRVLRERWERLESYVQDPIPFVDLTDRLPWDKILAHRWLHTTIKAYLWEVIEPDVDRIIWVDADCFQTRPIRMAELPTAPFSAVKDWLTTAADCKARWPAGAEIIDYFNAGVFVATREAKPCFDDLRDYFDRGGQPGPYGDQDLLNLFVCRRFGDQRTRRPGWNEIGPEWNYLFRAARPLRPILVHLAGMPDRELIMEVLWRAADEAERFARTGSSAANGRTAARASLP